MTKKVALNRPLSNFREGYEEWKENYAKKKAAIYKVGVSSAVGRDGAMQCLAASYDGLRSATLSSLEVGDTEDRVTKT